MSALQQIIDFARKEAYSDEQEIVNTAAAELAALREIARLATVIRTRYPGLLAVMWENDAEGSRKLPYMREKLDAALAALTQKGTTK